MSPSPTSPPDKSIQPLLRVENIDYDIMLPKGKKRILHHVSFDLFPQNFLTIIGPNGAGKSTLLHCLIGTKHPTQGKITRATSVRLGYVPQKIKINPYLPLQVSAFLCLDAQKDLSIRHFAQKMKNWIKPSLTYKEEAHALAMLDSAPITHLTNIAPLLNAPLYTLSGGELQRVLLARALLRNPNVLLLDEPTSGLDIHAQTQFYQILDEIHKKTGVAIIMVSHDLHVVMSSSHQVLCLSQRICCKGQPTDIAQDKEFIQLFGDKLGKQVALFTHDLKKHKNQSLM